MILSIFLLLFILVEISKSGNNERSNYGRKEKRRKIQQNFHTVKRTGSKKQ